MAVYNMLEWYHMQYQMICIQGLFDIILIMNILKFFIMEYILFLHTPLITKQTYSAILVVAVYNT